ncbi:MAG: glycosyltransferase family 4 protein [Gemmatimonadaceae bacterium]
MKHNVKPKVLFLSHSGVLGGAELFLLDLLHREPGIRERGTVGLLADGPFHERLEAEGIPVRVFATSAAVLGVRKGDTLRSGKIMRDVYALSRRVGRFARDFDLLYANSQKAFIVAALAGLWERRPVLWHLHDILDRDHFSETNLRVAVTVANWLASRVVANSRSTAEAFIAQGGRAHKVRTLYYGIAPAPFLAVTDAEVEVLRAEMGLGDAPTVGLFSRLSPWKGQHVLIEALPTLPGVHALLVGDALFGEEQYAEGLRAQAASLGVADRTHFLGFRTDLPRLMRLVNVVLHTSTAAEPFGRVIVEGMLAGRPVVASRAGGALEIIQDGVTGLLIQPGDPRALAAAVSSLIEHPDRADALGAAGRAYALAHFSLELMHDDVVRQIEEAARL